MSRVEPELAAPAASALPYRDHAEAELGRVLSWLDREPFSPTHGCFDRTYWAWKFTDFPAARFQEAVYAVADRLVHGERSGSGSGAGAGGSSPGQGRLEEWLAAGFRYWRAIQYKDGSFDEAYPFERSLAATAFTAFYVGEAYLLAGERLATAERAPLVAAFARAGEWLVRNDEGHGVLSNHLAAAAAALDVIARITGDERFARRSGHFLGRVLAHQSAEGWYEEYGGADPGYQVHGTFFLARLWQSRRDPVLLASLARSLAFLKHFVHPNRTLGGAHGSRNTELYFPAGIEILAAEIADAARIAAFMRPAVAAQTAAGLGAMDAWNLLPMLNSYLFAAAQARPLLPDPGALPCEQEGEWLFPDAGLLVRSSAAYHAVVGLSKGGVVRVHERAAGGDRSVDGARSRLVLDDCGWWADLGGGRIASSQVLVRPARFTRQGDALTVEQRFAAVNQRRMSPPLFVAFRLFSLTAGRLPRAAYWLKRRLVEVLVRRRREAPLSLIRHIRLGPDRVLIEDEVMADGTTDVRHQVRRLVRGTHFSSIHMGSSRYYQPQELEPPRDGEDRAAELARTGKVHSVTTWPALPLEGEGSP